MSTQPIGGNSPVNITGLGSGLDTNAIITALMAVERVPVTHLTQQQTKLQAQQTQLRTIQTSLQQLSLAAAELGSPTLFKASQSVSSSDPTRVGVTSSPGAGVGGYQVNVTQLANSAQRTFAFTSPNTAATVTIDGHATEVAAGATIQSFVNSINSDANATVYAAALENGKVVLSSRTTGDTGTEFIQVSDPGGTLVEQAGLSKQGRNAEYSVDGVAGKSTSNTVTNAIAGVSISLNALTTTSGPVTVNVAAPAPNTSDISAQIQSFVKLYNSTISALHTQLSTKPPSNPQTNGELGTGTLFGDPDISSVLNGMRRVIYSSVAGAPEGLTSLEAIGISTGGPAAAGGTSQSAIAGELTVNATTLTKALEANPTGIKEMLQTWAHSFQGVVNVQSQAGGTLDTRINGDGTRISNLTHQITTMNEMLAIRQRGLQAQYAALESVISHNQSQATWLASQTFPGFASNKN